MFDNASYIELLWVAAISFIAGWLAHGRDTRSRAKARLDEVVDQLNQALAIAAIVLGDGWSAEVPASEIRRLKSDGTRINLQTRTNQSSDIARLRLSVKPGMDQEQE